MTDEYFMKKALEYAHLAFDNNEVPVGCVIVKNNQIIAYGYNQKEARQDVTAHAEIECIKMASEVLNTYRLEDCTIYVTLEPCIMCAGAIYQSRIKRLVFGAFDEKNGSVVTKCHILNEPSLNHHVEITGAILQTECSLILKSFFKTLRKVKKE